MQILVMDLLGKGIVIDVEASDTIEEVKEKYANVRGIPASEQKLFYRNRMLEARRTVSEYGIEADGIIEISLKLRGDYKFSSK